MCVWCASGTFRIDAQHGRSRVYAQWVDSEDKIEVTCSNLPDSSHAVPDCLHVASCAFAKTAFRILRDIHPATENRYVDMGSAIMLHVAGWMPFQTPLKGGFGKNKHKA